MAHGMLYFREKVVLTVRLKEREISAIYKTEAFSTQRESHMS